MVRRTPEKHDSIPGKLRTNSTPALEPFSPALSSRLLFPHATRTHARHTHACTHAHTRACEQPPKTPPPRRRDGAQVVAYTDGARKQGGKESRDHFTPGTRQHGLAERTARLAVPTTTDCSSRAANTQFGSMQSNWPRCCYVRHLSPLSSWAVHWRKSSPTPRLPHLRWREKKNGENFWIYNK